MAFLPGFVKQYVPIFHYSFPGEIDLGSSL
jgi:hypothetical protein